MFSALTHALKAGLPAPEFFEDTKVLDKDQPTGELVQKTAKSKDKKAQVQKMGGKGVKKDPTTKKTAKAVKMGWQPCLLCGKKPEARDRVDYYSSQSACWLTASG